MKEIALSSGDRALIDDADEQLVSSRKWHVKRAGKRSLRKYARANVQVAGKTSALYMHRLIMGSRDGYVVDHINGDGLDNRRENLRWVTAQQNCLNRTHKSFSKHGAFGLSFVPYTQNKGKRWIRRKPWRACIHIKGKPTNLGYFLTKQEAEYVAATAIQERGIG